MSGAGAAAFAIQLATGLLFVAAGAQKLLHLGEFRGIVSSYRLLPEAWAPSAAVVLAPLEASLGLCAVLQVGSPYVPLALAALLASFAVAMAINIARGRTEIHCGCFRTTLRQELRWRLVVRNLVCALAVSIASAISVAPREVWMSAIPAGIALVTLYGALDSVWALDASRRAAFGRG